MKELYEKLHIPADLVAPDDLVMGGTDAHFSQSGFYAKVLAVQSLDGLISESGYLEFTTTYGHFSHRKGEMLHVLRPLPHGAVPEGR